MKNMNENEQARPKFLQSKFSILLLKAVLFFIGTAISMCGFALMTINGLGSNAMNTLFVAVADNLGILPGVVYTVFNSTFVIVGFLFARKYMGIGSILMILVQGWFLDTWLELFSSYENLFSGFWMKLLIIVISYLLSRAGGGLSTSMCLGTAGFEACLFTLADKIKIEYKYLKILADMIYFGVALFLGGVYGVMTIVEVLFYGPGLSFFIILFNKTLLKKLGIADERNELSRNKGKIFSFNRKV